MSRDDGPNDNRRRSSSGERVPPNNPEAEDGLLGAAIVWSRDLVELVSSLDPAIFYRPGHANVFAAVRTIIAAGLKPDPVLIEAELEKAGTSSALGSIDLGGLMVDAPTPSSAERYAEILADLAQLRSLIAAGAEISALAYTPGTEAEAALAAARQYLEGASQRPDGHAIRKADLGALIAGGLTLEEPDFMVRSDGRALLYSGKLHMFQGDPAGGKTWLALWAAVEILQAGGAVIFIDYEDHEIGITGRLLALGAPPDAIIERFSYLQIEARFGTAEQVRMRVELDDLIPDLVVIDGVAEALARGGLSEDSASDFVGWAERFPRWIATHSGAAVVLLDHLKKDAEGKGRWARGTGAKLGAVDGAAYTIKTIRSFSREHAGAVKLTVAKDRPGGVGPIGYIAGVASFDPSARGAHVDVRLDPDADKMNLRDAWKPTILMHRVSEELEKAGSPLSARVLKDMVHAQSPRLVSEAIARLVAEGFLMEERQGRTKVLRLVKPYTDDAEAPEDPQEALELPDENVVRGPWPPKPDDPLLEF